MARKREQRRSKDQQASKAKQIDDKSEKTAGTPAVQALSYQSGIRPGSVDVTGIVPESVHVDPDILEGQPGYEESGNSGIMPTDLSRRVAAGPTKHSNS